MKPGVKTSEFWLTVVVLIAGAFLIATSDLTTYPGQQASDLGHALVTFSLPAYLISRGVAKLGAWRR